MKQKKKTIQSVNVAAVHELSDVSSNEDTSQRSQQTGSTYGSSISSQASNPTGVFCKNVTCHIGIALEYTA
jgi:hypothetical protein